mmetsp:Transcript_5391/g.9948  ORF Transcript_5391/g.9948 Transcript_5391/m.9948 type:complete len:81 (+) Transcript_5391:3477-3719(+)
MKATISQGLDSVIENNPVSTLQIHIPAVPCSSMIFRPNPELTLTFNEGEADQGSSHVDKANHSCHVVDVTCASFLLEDAG